MLSHAGTAVHSRYAISTIDCRADVAVHSRTASVSVDNRGVAVFTNWRHGNRTMMAHNPTLFKEVPRVVKDYMGVGAAKAESVDGYAPQTGRRPWNALVRDLKSVLAQLRDLNKQSTWRRELITSTRRNLASMSGLSFSKRALGGIIPFSRITVKRSRG